MLVTSLSLIALLALFLVCGVWIGLALVSAGLLTAFLFTSIPLNVLLPQYIFNVFTTPDLIALPLYILMGEILFRTKLAAALFSGLAPWASLLPGRLLHVNVIGCSMFAAVAGSSVATIQVVGKITSTELLKRGYQPSIATGSLAGAGTLGFLIPPSTVMIIYGVLANTSIIRLFTAGVIPGLLLAIAFMGWIMIHSKINPGLVPDDNDELKNMPFREKLKATKDLLPAFFLIVCVLGTMYLGLATPSEAAAIGVVGALIVAWLQKGITRKALREIAVGTICTSSMMGLIILGATLLGGINAFLGVPTYFAELIGGLNLSAFELILLLTVLYLVLGLFLEGFSIIVTTLPVFLPIVVAAGFDPIWFGIYLVIVVEMAQITPPLGFNFFAIQSMTGYSIKFLAKATLPYLIIMIMFVLLVTIFPEIVMWLPNKMFG
ncbi:TRAP transporter large permease [Halomonas sp.]|uniref:TRAP transporter large permease n=1 Tax=Halomonas sp. TaxID=1486246 RepID=UPI003A92699A